MIRERGSTGAWRGSVEPESTEHFWLADGMIGPRMPEAFASALPAINDRRGLYLRVMVIEAVDVDASRARRALEKLTMPTYQLALTEVRFRNATKMYGVTEINAGDVAAILAHLEADARVFIDQV